jgi:hypothetical protein
MSPAPWLGLVQIVPSHGTIEPSPLGFGIIGTLGVCDGAVTPGVPEGGVACAEVDDCVDVDDCVEVEGASVVSEPQAGTAKVSRNSALPAMSFFRI